MRKEWMGSRGLTKTDCQTNQFEQNKNDNQPLNKSWYGNNQT